MIEVPIGECRCPETPHEGDIVWLKPKPDLDMGLAARGALTQNGGLVGDTDAAFYSVLIRHGVAAWNIVDEKAQPVPVTHPNILDRLTWAEGGAIVALRAQQLYQDAVLDPLALANAALLPRSHVNGSTQATPRSGASTPKSSRPSSPSRRVASA